MTTANGLPRTEHIRKAIETLIERRAWVVQRLDAKKAANPDFQPDTTYDGREVRALDLAIEVLEAEWDFVARLQREIRAWEGRARTVERRVEAKAKG